MFISKKRYEDEMRRWFEAGVTQGLNTNQSAIAMAWEEGYNNGKTDGIELAKRAFTKVLKQKQEKSNDVLRQN